MLNLSCVFDDAVRALAGHADRLAVAPLPAAVYLMQVDVINHYQYALDHYFTVPLDAPFLQNSSLGTPYQKWAHFTNEDFELLSFAVHNLLRYTSRLIHESDFRKLRADRPYRHEERKHAYTESICEIRYWGKAVGVTADPDCRLSITAVRTEPSKECVTCRATAAGPSYFRIVRGADGAEREEPIRLDEYQRIVQVLRTETFDITDRARLVAVRERGHAEVAELQERNRAFREVCDSFYQSRSVVEPFEKLNESHWT